MRRVSGRWNDDPIAGLYAEARNLCGIVLSRLAAAGCDIDDLLRAEAIVSANIGELVAAPEWAALLDRPDGRDRIRAVRGPPAHPGTCSHPRDLVEGFADGDFEVVQVERENSGGWTRLSYCLTRAL